MIIKINSKCKQYKKENKTMQRSLCKSLEHLVDKIEAEGSNINKIYNNDSIIYDRINDHIFIFKTHGRDNTQLRIVYSFEYKHGDSILYLLDYANKKKNDKEYLSQLNSKYKDVRISDLMFSDLIPVA